MLAFSNDYYGIIFRATQSVELFCAYDILTRGVREFPYNIDISSIELNLSNNKVSDDCLWKTFLNQTLKARHNVAHGISFDNTMSIEEIKNTREKIVILEKLFAVLIFKYGIK